MNTRHASLRCRQRGIEPMALELLARLGTEVHDGRGATVQYFDKESRRRMKRELGHRAVARFAEWTDAYAIVSNDGAVITTGHRTQRMRRR